MSTITIRLPLPQLNDVLREAKGHWGAYSGPKKKLTRAIALQALVERMTRITDPYHVAYQWYPEDRRTDPDNFLGGKYILDGLVAAKALPGDGYRWVRSIHHVFCPPDKDHPRVVATFTPEAP